MKTVLDTVMSKEEKSSDSQPMNHNPGATRQFDDMQSMHSQLQNQMKEMLLESRLKAIENQMVQNMCIQTAITTQIALQSRFYTPSPYSYGPPHFLQIPIHHLQPNLIPKFAQVPPGYGSLPGIYNSFVSSNPVPQVPTAGIYNSFANTNTIPHVQPRYGSSAGIHNPVPQNMHTYQANMQQAQNHSTSHRPNFQQNAQKAYSNRSIQNKVGTVELLIFLHQIIENIKTIKMNTNS